MQSGVDIVKIGGPESHLWSRPVYDNFPPRQISLGDRSIVCESAEDLKLLKEALALETDPKSVLQHSIGRLHLIKEACQRYSLGKYQRLASQAINRAGK